jgi:signal transduction histidine kinase
MVSGVFFALITATVASLFGYTQHAVHKRLVNQNLTLKLMTAEIEEQNKMLKEKNEEITSINNRLEERVAERTLELEDHNRKLAEYAFINSHLLRGPLCSILGLINLLNNTSLSEKEKEILMHLKESSHNLDDVVSKISKALSNGPELDRDLIRNLKEK